MLSFEQIGKNQEIKTHITMEDETIRATRVLCSRLYTITTTLPIGTGDFANKANNLVNLTNEEFRDFSDLTKEDMEDFIDFADLTKEDMEEFKDFADLTDDDYEECEGYD